MKDEIHQVNHPLFWFISTKLCSLSFKIPCTSVKVAQKVYRALLLPKLSFHKDNTSCLFMVLIKAVSHNYSERQFSQTHEHCFEIKRQPLKLEVAIKESQGFKARESGKIDVQNSYEKQL